jgi:RND family efflux transporter MFP subunit
MKKIIISASISLAAILLVGSVFYYFNSSRKATYDFVAVKNADIKADVAVTGKTKAAEEVDLAFEKSGKLSKIYVKVGDLVKADQPLAQLSANDLSAQLNQAQAAYLAQVANLAGLQQGASQADLNVTKTQVGNAEQTIADAQLNLANTKNKAQSDLGNLYAKAKDILNDASLKSNDAIVNNAGNFFTNIQSNTPKYDYTTYYSTFQSQVESEYANVYQLNTDLKNKMNVLSDDQAIIDSELTVAKTQLQSELNFLRDLIDLLDKSNNIEANKAGWESGIGLSANSINAAIIAINSEQQAITAQNTLNKNLITAAQSQLDQAKNSLATADSQLSLKKAGATHEQLLAQQAMVQSALANVQNVQAQLAKSTLVSPIDGVISKQDGSAGEIVAANAPIISVLSNAKYQVETQIPEAEVGNVKIGQLANVNLDAYGTTKNFTAKVISIDLASNMTTGVPTYKTTLEFAADDQAIKAGLSANLEIIIAEHKNVLVVPQSSVLKSGEKNFVIVDNNSQKGEQRQVNIGITSDDGLIEIISGLSANERVAYFGNINN